MPDLYARIGSLGRSAISTVAFEETFNTPVTPVGRGGDMNYAHMSVSRCAPGGLAFGVNPVRHSTIPAAVRASFTGGSTNLTSNSVANPTVVTSATAHNFQTGDVVTIAGVSGSSPTINGVRTVTRIDATSFSVPVNVTVGGTGGTVRASVYPPYDMLVCDGTGLFPGALMMAACMQDYGHHAIRPLQPFDFQGRTGAAYCIVTAQCFDSLASYLQISLTEDPAPAPTYHITDNEETGPTCRNGILVMFGGAVGSGTNTGVSSVFVYTDYVKAQITASFELTGTNRPTTAADKLNRVELRVSATHLQVWMSDYSTDNVTFSNFRLIWEADITAPMTQAYVHYGFRIHSNIKFNYPATSIRYWTKVGFDGPKLPRPVLYEVPDNTTTDSGGDNTYSDYPWNYQNLGYETSDGSGRSEGVWDGAPSASLISPLTFNGSVNLVGKTSAVLTLQWFVQSITHTPDTTWGLKYQFNGGTWRTYSITSSQVTSLINEPGTAGYLNLAIPITFADLVSGTNTIDFSSVNVPQDYAPIVQNIDLLVS
jgi:hypothetical protein